MIFVCTLNALVDIGNMQMISLIGATLCFISSVAEVYEYGSSKVYIMDSFDRKMLSLRDHPPKLPSRSSGHDPKPPFVWDQLNPRLLPIGDLLRSMSGMAAQMFQADEKNRSASLQFGSILKKYRPEIVPHISSGDVFREYDHKMLPALHEIYDSLINETQLIGEDAGVFAASCKRNNIDELVLKFNIIFRENCHINCEPTGPRTPERLFEKDCILETLASDNEYRKQNVTPRVQQYDRDLFVLLVAATFCNYSQAENFRSGCDLNCTMKWHTAQIGQITDHMFEYVNRKMEEAWPRSSTKVAEFAFSQSMSSYMVDRDQTVNRIFESLNKIGDYRHTYQVFLANANSLTVASADMDNVLLFFDQWGRDWLVVRHKVGSRTTRRAERARRIMQDNSKKLARYLDYCNFWPEDMNDVQTQLRDKLHLTLPLEQTYSTVVFQRFGNDFDYKIASDNDSNYWIDTRRERIRGCIPFRLIFLL